MINASGEFQNIIMNERRNFKYALVITFMDGTKKNIDDTMLVTSGNSITISAGSSSLPLGNAVSRILRLNLSNINNEWSEYNFLGATISVSLSLELSDEKVEKLYLGTYTVVEPESYGTTIGINALDSLFKADRKFDTANLTFPMSARDVFVSACLQSGLDYKSIDFPNNDYMMQAPESDITCRRVLGQCALLAGGNALCDEYGRVFIQCYKFEEQTIYDGGVFDNDTPYSTGISADGGSFAYDDGDTLDGGEFNDLNQIQVFSNAYNTTIGTDDVVITQIRATRDDVTAEFGTSDTYTIQIATDMLADLQDACDRIGAVLVGHKYRPFDIDHSCYPLAEMGDYCIVVDRKGNSYGSIVTDIEFNFRGKTTISCKSDNPTRNSSVYLSEETRAIARARKDIKNETTTRELAIQAVEEEIANSNGMYETEITDEETGAVTRYMHNKPKLEDSAIQWRFSAEVISVSTDFGENWNATLDASGTEIVKRLLAEQIVADVINGGTLTLGGAYGTRNDGQIEIRDANNNLLITLGKTGEGTYGIKFSNNCKIAYSDLSGTPTIPVLPDGILTTTNITYTTVNAPYLTAGKANIVESLKVSNPESGKVYVSVGDYEAWYTQWAYINQGNFVVGYSHQDLGHYAVGGSGYSYAGVIKLWQYGDAYYPYWSMTPSYSYSSVDMYNLASTPDYNNVALCSVSSATPIASDNGEGKTDEYGVCEVYLDDVFAETLNLNCQYQVILQAYGDGNLYVSERTPYKFVVNGTPNLEFGWQILASVSNSDGKRLQTNLTDAEETDNSIELVEKELFDNLYNPESEVF